MSDVVEVAGPEIRTCANCNRDWPVAEGTWAFKPGGAAMKICFPCQQARKADSHAERVKHPAVPKKDKDKSTDALAVRKEAKLDVAKALKIGARVTNDHAEMVMARVLQYANDPESKHHVWALELLAQRILPRKLYEELGGQAAGVGSLQERRPSFQINILPAHPGDTRVVSGEVTTLELPSPEQE